MTIGRIHGLPLPVFRTRETQRYDIDLGPSPFAMLFRAIAQGMRRRNQRIAMARLSDHLLRDIGMTRAEAKWGPKVLKPPR